MHATYRMCYVRLDFSFVNGAGSTAVVFVKY